MRARVVGQAPVRAAAARRRPPLPRPPDEVARWLRTARRSLDEADYEERTLEEYVAERALLAALPRPLPRPAHLGALVDGARSGRSTSRPRTRSASSTTTACSASARFRWRTVVGGADTLRRGAARPARRQRAARARRALAPADAGRRASCAPTTATSTASTRSSSRPTPTRRFACSRIRATTSGGCSAPGARRANEAVLHTDTPLPAAHAGGAGVVELPDERTREARPSRTTSTGSSGSRATSDWCVTLNRTDEIDPEHDRRRARSSSTRSTRSRACARSASCRRLSGERHTLYAGAYHGNGFHEDGLASGVRAAAALGVALVRSALYTGTLMHSRREPRRNTFRYPVAYFLLDLDELPRARAAPAAPLGQSAERRLAPRPRLHGRRRHAAQGRRRPLLRRARPRGRARADAHAAARARLRLQPGHLPLVLRAGRPARRASSPSSSNTFGERLPELLDGDSLRYEHEKRLHVSPFFGLDQSYEYAFSEPGDEVWARIHVREDGRSPLTRRPARPPARADERDARAVPRPLPAHAAAGDALIHWQALKLYLRGVPFHHKPPFEPGQGLGPAVSTLERTLRRAASGTARPGSAASPSPLLERVLPGIEERHARRAAARTARSGASARAPSSAIEIHDARFFRRIATRPKLALGESYQAGEWTTDDLPGVLELLLRNSIAGARAAPGPARASRTRGRASTGARACSPPGGTSPTTTTSATTSSRCFLDETMTYSCAVFADAEESLADAQRRKLRLVCDKLELESRATTCSRSAAAGARSRSRPRASTARA